MLNDSSLSNSTNNTMLPNQFTISYDNNIHWDIQFNQLNNNEYEMSVYNDKGKRLIQSVNNTITKQWYDWGLINNNKNVGMNTQNVTLSVWNDQIKKFSTGLLITCIKLWIK